MKKHILFIFLVNGLLKMNAQITYDTIVNSYGSTTNLNGSYSVPLGVKKIKIHCWGGGGAGGAAIGQASAGGGGAGGAYVQAELGPGPGEVFSYSIGNGGNGALSSINRNGGSTWFGSNTLLLAKGGNGGSSASLNFSTAIGATAFASGNIIFGAIASSYYGGNGGTGIYGANGSQAGGGGGAAGLTGNGNPGVASNGGIAGMGGGNGASAGTWQLPLNCNCNGTNGATPGGGGSGGQSTASIDHQGGHGGPGMIIIEEIRPGIGGQFFNDLNANCIIENETGVQGIKLQINPGNYITTTDINGNWKMNNLPIGNYVITVDTTLKDVLFCNIVQNIAVLDTTEFYNIGAIGVVNPNCPILDITIYAPNLTRCFNRTIYVEACNHLPSSQTLNASYVDVELDPLLTVTGATLPFTSLGNNVFRFQTGNINPGECVDFNISSTVSCNAMLGQTLCMDATLYPIESCVLDTVPSNPPSGGGGSTGTLNGFPQPCTLPWDQSSLSVDGWCANDSIYFTITNTGQPGGGDMECYSPMWITVDGVVTYTDSIMIPGGQTITLSFPGDGQTWILNAEQHPLHPGNSHPNAHVEACGDTTNWTPGLVNELPLDDADPVVDIYCGVVTGSFDPNDKTGYPLGQTSERYIQPNQQLQYVIRFQNTGTDTAFTVVIRDTLDTDLNIFTVTPGVSSHDYSFQMYGPRVLEWTFNNIHLPDSTTDLEGSNGFVTFHVEQVPDLAPGTLITNDADIYFDFNDPITTNTTVHRIYEGFISVAELEALSKEKSAIKVYPNPSTGIFTIQTESLKTAPFLIYNQFGTLIEKGSLNYNQTHLELNLNSGVYFLQIENEVVKFSVIK